MIQLTDLAYIFIGWFIGWFMGKWKYNDPKIVRGKAAKEFRKNTGLS